MSAAYQKEKARADALASALLELLKDVYDRDGTTACEHAAYGAGITHNARCEPCDNDTAPVVGKLCVVCWSVIPGKINRKGKPI